MTVLRRNQIAKVYIRTTLAFLNPPETKVIYNLNNKVEQTDLSKTSYQHSFSINNKLTVSSLWNRKDVQLLEFKLETPKLSVKSIKTNEFTEKSSPILSKYLNEKFYLLLNQGKVVEFLADDENKDVYVINLKRGLASLFQFQAAAKPTREFDLLGNCNVFYKKVSSTKLQKTKTECRNWNLEVARRAEEPLGIGLKSHQVIDYDLTENGHLKHLVATEIHESYVKSKNDAGGKIKSVISLNLEYEEKSVNQILADDYKQALLQLTGVKPFSLEADIDGQASNIRSEGLKKLIKAHKSELLNYKIGLLSTAEAFAKILPTVRITKTEELAQILKSPSMQESRKQIIDLFAAAQTIQAHNAVLEVLEFENEDDFLEVERYLQAISISTRPNGEILKDLFERLKSPKSTIENEKLHDSLIQATASIANRYSKFSPNLYNDKLVVKVKDYFLHKLNKCNTADCKTLYIRGFQNLQDPTTIQTLFETALKDEPLVSVAAMKALKMFDIIDVNESNRLDLEKVFYQKTRKFDSSARILALDILLNLRPTKGQLENLINYLSSNDKAFEVKTYLIQKLRMLMGKCLKFRALATSILNEKSEINNYHVIGQKGLTTALERNLYSIPAFNESLLSSQEIYKGILKQGSVDLILKSGTTEFTTFNLGLYTRGLSSYGDGDGESSDEEGEEEEEASAGMEIAVQGVHFRPLVFFTTHSELIGHIMSGTASEPTTAYQATVLQQDHEAYILLQNGATIYIQVLGAKSIDLNGKVSVSWWTRDAHTEIIQNSGSFLFGFISYSTSFLKMTNTFFISGEPKINVIADFITATKTLCIKLEKPHSSLRHTIKKSLEIFGTKYTQKHSAKFNYIFPGHTMALNQKNNEMCNEIPN